MTKLTAKTVESLARAGIPGYTGDGNGLYFQVSQAGGKSWVFRYKKDGKSRMMGLGRYPETTLSQAREKAIALRHRTNAGIDPLEARDQELARLREEQVRQERIRLEEAAKNARLVTFEKAAGDYIKSHRVGWRNAKHAQQWENTLRTYVFPVIGPLQAGDISTEHILQILTPIWSTKPETASRIRNRIELVLDAAKALGSREGENPARWRGHLDKLLPARSRVRKVQHHAALSWRELPAFMAKLESHEELSYQAMRLTILTACRTSEVLSARWAEFDFQTQTWTIPASRMKANREHRVPLSSNVVNLLERLPRIEGSPFVFPGTRTAKPISNMAMLMALRRMNRGDLTMHGFRSTFRDWAAENTHYPREICEMALAHAVATGAEAAYWRSDVFAKRRALMADWATYATTGQ